MFRNTLCASEKTELSNALAVWTCDSRATLSETRPSMLDCSGNPGSIPPHVCEPRHERQEQRAPGLIVFCHCPQVGFIPENKSTERRLVPEGICLMSDLPDF